VVKNRNEIGARGSQTFRPSVRERFAGERAFDVANHTYIKFAPDFENGKTIAYRGHFGIARAELLLHLYEK